MGSQLNRLRMKHRRAGRIDVGALHEDTSAFLMEYEPSESVKYGEDRELEIVADVWAFVHENIERQHEAEKWKSYTREDWAELEYAYVERSEYTEMDLFDDILNEYEAGKITADEAEAKAKKYRKCNYRFCLNVFEPSRKDQRYCPASDCRQREDNAVKRFERTGTYLPVGAYKSNRNDTDQGNYEEMERSRDMAADGDMYVSFIRKDKYGGLRDRQREAYDYMKVIEKDLKNFEEYPVETYLKRHKNPVSSEGNRSERPFLRSL